LYIVFPAALCEISATKKTIVMALKQIEHGSKAYQQMVQLRLDILRKPLGLSFTKEELDNEKNDILIAAFDEDDILGCCILTKIDNTRIRLRQMAVQKNLQGKGIGESMISFAENIARDKGYKILTMHARDTAIGFYEKYGYVVKGAQFVEVKTEHHVMEKVLM
jgi:ribosomal protein S18 acetylase RimI-like enzyme